MSQANVEALYRVYDATRRGDLDAFLSDMHADVEGMFYFMEAEGVVFKGHAGMRRYWDEVFSVFSDWHPEIVGTTDYGDTILAEIKIAGRGSRSGVAHEQTAWQIIRFRNGKIVWFHGYATRAEALKAVGLSD